ncbi:MAG: hypothetical protein ACRDKB_14675 [Actinomycetota bacterium]
MVLEDEPARGDYFDRARRVAATGLFVAGVLAVAGSLLPWVEVTPPLVVPEAEAERADALIGIEISDGRVVLVAGVVIIAAAALLVLRRRSGWAWLALAASILVGAIGISDYRQVSGFRPEAGVQPPFVRRAERAGEVDPAFALILVAAAGIVGLVASVGALAATPSDRQSGRV